MSTNTTQSLYAYLSERVPPGIYGWLPLNVAARDDLPATPRRIAWAIREIAGTSYGGHLAAKALGAHRVAEAAYAANAGFGALASTQSVLAR